MGIFQEYVTSPSGQQFYVSTAKILYSYETMVFEATDNCVDSWVEVYSEQTPDKEYAEHLHRKIVTIIRTGQLNKLYY